MTSAERISKLTKYYLAKNGLQVELRQLQEECCEVSIAVNLLLDRGRIRSPELLDECADVFILLDMIREVYGPEFDYAIERKLSRAEARIEAESAPLSIRNGRTQP